jgi:hypothetical protein
VFPTVGRCWAEVGVHSVRSDTKVVDVHACLPTGVDITSGKSGGTGEREEPLLARPRRQGFRSLAAARGGPTPRGSAFLSKMADSVNWREACSGTHYGQPQRASALLRRWQRPETVEAT